MNKTMVKALTDDKSGHIAMAVLAEYLAQYVTSKGLMQDFVDNKMEPGFSAVLIDLWQRQNRSDLTDTGAMIAMLKGKSHVG